jgi:hypothetical protein
MVRKSGESGEVEKLKSGEISGHVQTSMYSAVTCAASGDNT